MKKLKYIFLLMLVLTATLVTSCVDRLEATKYTIDTLHMKNGKELTGIILGTDQYRYTIEEEKSSSVKVILKSDTSSFGRSDHIYQKNGDIISCSIEKIDVEIKDKDGEIVEFDMSDVAGIYYDQNQQNYSIRMKSRQTQVLRGQIVSDTVGVVTKYGERRIKTDLIQSISFDGTPKEEEQSMADLWNNLAQNMGVQNVVPKSETGRKDNGWLFTLIGILVVFVALLFMVIVFTLMKNLNPDNKKKDTKKEVQEADEKTTIKVKDGEIHPDIVSAIALTIALSDGGEKPKLTFKDKSAPSNWAYSGRADSIRRGNFNRKGNKNN